LSAYPLPRLLSRRLPFFYGWVILGCLCCVGFARQGPAVATLSIFVEPLAREFGWSRTAISGAVSLGGLLAALSSPWIGPLLDRHGARFILCLVVLVNSALLMALSTIASLTGFYVFFCLARMNWAGPFDLGIYGAVNNWFVARRAFATSVATLAQMAGLVAMPLIAELAIAHQGWRAGWLSIGIVTLAAGFVPCWLLLVRRPEDLGLVPDRTASSSVVAADIPDLSYSRRQATRTASFWLLLVYTVLVYPVQAGVSLHQAPHLIERGIDPTIAATVVSTFSLMSGLCTIVVGMLPRRLPIRYPLAAVAAVLAASTAVMLAIHTPFEAFLGAGLFGFGVGGILTLLPMAWADYFGRAHYGAIRSVALSVQVLAQAVGPVLSGALRDWTGAYDRSLECFTVLACLGIAAALTARPPRP
jgi:MFS family permease